jgi:type VI secretion system secreted protein Hcp
VGVYWKTERSGKGDATEKKHNKWIKIHSVSFGSGRNVKSRTGRAADREAGTGYLGEIMINKDMDSSSVFLFKSTCAGHGEKMEIHVTRAGSGDDKSEIEYLKYVLEDALITGYSCSSTGGKPSETLTLNFSKITMTYAPQSSSVKDESAITVSYHQGKTKAEGA